MDKLNEIAKELYYCNYSELTEMRKGVVRILLEDKKIWEDK